MKKKTLLVISGTFAAVAFLLGVSEPFLLCGNYWRECMDLNYQVDLVILPFIPLFMFSLITYKMREDVYSAWLRFALVWIPLSMLGIFFSPEYGSSMYYAVTKSSVALISTLVFVIVSTGVILWRYTARKMA